MEFVKSKIFLIAETKLCNSGVEDFLKHLNVSSWDTNTQQDAQKLIEISGKTCYMSFDTKLNANLTKVRTNQNRDYIQEAIIKSGHTSVLEHATVTFALCDVSRILTHELVRHRAGCAYSQESGRYVRKQEIEYYMPKCFNKEEQDKLRRSLSEIEIMYKGMVDTAFKRIGDDFKSKKEITSALRRLLPGGQTTTIIFTANHRALRHILQMRTSVHAEEEIRDVFTRMLNILKEGFPNIYEDIEV